MTEIVTTHPARFLPSPDAKPVSGLGTLATWCPHCERVHTHGAAGRGAQHRVEKRGAHCDAALGSPMAGRGVSLLVDGSIDAVDEVKPAAPMVRAGLQLHRQLADAAAALRGALLRTLTARRAVRQDMAAFRLEGHEVAVLDLGLFWTIGGRDSDASGRGLLSLAASLYGVTPGIAGRRILETTAGIRLPPDVAIEIEATLDRWSQSNEAAR